MATTRRDLERIADALADVRRYVAGEFDLSADDVLLRVDDAIADALSDTTGFDVNGNRKFKRDKFLARAGGR